MLIDSRYMVLVLLLNWKKNNLKMNLLFFHIELKRVIIKVEHYRIVIIMHMHILYIRIK